MNGLDVVERLEALPAGGATGDWLDVVRRCERQRAARLRRRTLLAAAALVLLAAPALALADRLNEWLVVSGDESKAEVPWARDRQVFNLGGQDVIELDQPLSPWRSMGHETSPAVPSPDGKELLYHALEQLDRKWNSRNLLRATSVLRIRDLESGSERVLDRGAFSAAWREDGAIAYARALRRDFPFFVGRLAPGGGDTTPVEGPFGHVVVRATADDAPARWTTKPSNYRVHGWADRHLLVSAQPATEAMVQRYFHAEQAEPGVYALSGPGEERPLPIATIIAIDPTGDLVVGAVADDQVSIDGYTLRVVRVSDSQVLSELNIQNVVLPAENFGEAMLMSGGSWAGDFLTLGTWTYPKRSAIAVLRWTGDELVPEHVLRLDKGSESPGVRELYDPRFVDREGRQIVALTDEDQPGEISWDPAAVVLVCDRVDRRCDRTKLSAKGVLVENRSRPLSSSGG